MIKIKELFSLGNLLILIAIGVLVSPFALSYYGSTKKAEIIQTSVPSMSEEERKTYNERLKMDFAENESLPEISHTPKTIFKTNLKPIGVISIPKIEEKLPVYMGISEDALALGTAILDKTSYPTGELGTNTIITGHRGVPSQNIFKNLDKIEVGDFVYIDLNEKDIFRFKATSIEVVEPSQIEKFQLHEDRAMVTLVTCTPYLINSHRLLIFCDFDARIPNPSYEKGHNKETEKMKDGLLRAVSEKDVQKNEKDEEIIIPQSEGFWYKVKLMNPINIAIGFILIVLLSNGIFYFIPDSWIKEIFLRLLNFSYKIVALLGIILGILYSGYHISFVIL